MTITPDAKRKLTLLLPMLASDKDGEVVASVRKIARVLASEGKDFHDLTKLLTGGEPTIIFHTFRQPARERPERQPRESEWAAKARFCAHHADALREREATFVHDMVEKLKRWSEPTEKQAAWLDAIHQRLRRQYDETA